MGKTTRTRVGAGLLSLLLLCASMQAAPPAPLLVSADTGTVGKRDTIITVTATGVDPKAGVQWRYDEKALSVKRINKTTLYVAGPPGVYVIEVEALKLNKEGETDWQRSRVTLTIEDKTPAPGPTPPGPVPPGPTPPPATAPIAGPGLRMLIIEESGDRTKLTRGQVQAIGSATLRDYLRSKSKEKPGDMPYRIWDKDQDPAGDDKEWQDAYNAAKARPDFSIPWLVISDGKTGESVPLPKTFTETFDKVKKYGGG